MRTYASAPGKAILLGEHSVVYRGPAIVLAINLRAHVWAEERRDNRIQIEAPNLGVAGYFEGGRYRPLRGGAERWRSLNPIRVVAEKAMRRVGIRGGFNIRVESEIPPAVGLGSSAAISVATAASVLLLSGEEGSREEICEIAYEGERIVHGTPSGIDNHISTYGGALRYERARGFERFGVEELPLIIGDSGRRRSTGALVARVRRIRERYPDIIEAIIEAIARLSEEGYGALRRGDLKRVGELMNMDHGLLSALGVSTPELDRMVNAARTAGALGAKLTGAGGGGCIVALVEEARRRRVSEAVRRAGGRALRAPLSEVGVEMEVVEP